MVRIMNILIELKKISFIISLCCMLLALEVNAASYTIGKFGTVLLTMRNKEAQTLSEGPQPFQVDGKWFKFVGFRMFDLPSKMNEFMSLELPRVGSQATYRLNYSPVLTPPRARTNPHPVGRPNPNPEEKDKIIEYTIQRVDGPPSKIPVSGRSRTQSR